MSWLDNLGLGNSGLDSFRRAGGRWESRPAAWGLAGRATGQVLLGRALRLAGQKRAARAILEQAVALRPRFETYGALGDASFPLAAPPAPANADRSCLVLDISDLLHFFISHGLVSGIQRVQLEILSSLLAGAVDTLGDFGEVIFCFAELSWSWRLEERDLRSLLAYARAGKVDARRARRLVRRIKARAWPYAPPAGSSYLVLGAFWVADRQAHRRARSGGATLGVFVHDLFPIRLPALCEEGAAAAFETRLRADLPSWDFIVANSAYTAGDIRDYLAENRLAGAIPVLAVPLAHHIPSQRPLPGRRRGRRQDWRSPAGAPPRAPPRALQARPFVLCVGTLEPRKNLDALLDTWKALGRLHPDLPELVLVGRQGWRMDEMAADLRGGEMKRRKIRWLENISDERLEALYSGCLFTVYPSLAEGWGLPIGESLARGKVCVTSNTTAMPEVGGDFAIYTDPSDHDSLRSAIESLLYDEGVLSGWEHRIAHDFRPRTWREVTGDLMAAISAVAPRL
jgi:glycosyltransferase involved in cell wall biosynthesis